MHVKLYCVTIPKTIDTTYLIKFLLHQNCFTPGSSFKFKVKMKHNYKWFGSNKCCESFIVHEKISLILENFQFAQNYLIYGVSNISHIRSV